MVCSRCRAGKKVHLQHSLPLPPASFQEWERTGPNRVQIQGWSLWSWHTACPAFPASIHSLGLQLPSQIPIKMIFQRRSRRKRQFGSRVVESRGHRRRLCLDKNGGLSMSLVCHSTSQRPVAPQHPQAAASCLNLCPLAAMYSFPRRGRKFLCLTK